MFQTCKECLVADFLGQAYQKIHNQEDQWQKLYARSLNLEDFFASGRFTRNTARDKTNGKCVAI